VNPFLRATLRATLKLRCQSIQGYCSQIWVAWQYVVELFPGQIIRQSISNTSIFSTTKPLVTGRFEAVTLATRKTRGGREKQGIYGIAFRVLPLSYKISDMPIKKKLMKNFQPREEELRLKRHMHSFKFHEVPGTVFYLELFNGVKNGIRFKSHPSKCKIIAVDEALQLLSF